MAKKKWKPEDFADHGGKVLQMRYRVWGKDSTKIIATAAGVPPMILPLGAVDNSSGVITVLTEYIPNTEDPKKIGIWSGDILAEKSLADIVETKTGLDIEKSLDDFVSMSFDFGDLQSSLAKPGKKGKKAKKAKKAAETMNEDPLSE